jgi:hypothetical protein
MSEAAEQAHLFISDMFHSCEHGLLREPANVVRAWPTYDEPKLIPHNRTHTVPHHPKCRFSPLMGLRTPLLFPHCTTVLASVSQKLKPPLLVGDVPIVLPKLGL